MENRQYSLQEVLSYTIAELQRINVPISMIKQIGKPIANAVNNLQQCVIALDLETRKQTEAAPEAAPEEEPEEGDGDV